MLAASTHRPPARANAPAPASRRSPASASPALNPAWSRLATSIQRAPTVSQPGDRHEQEADAVADQIMRMTDSTLGAATAAPPSIQRKCACGGDGGACTCGHHENDNDDTHINLKQTAAHPGAASAAALSGAAGVARQGGAPLSAAARSYFEPRFGRSFADVRIHTDPGAAAAASGIQARAYTLGNRVVFGAGEYSHDTPRGRRLLAHELAHVVQQTGGGSAGPIARTSIGSELVLSELAGSAAPTIQRAVASVGQTDAQAESLIRASQNPATDAGVRAVALVWGILHFYFPAESAGLWVNVVSYDDATPNLSTSQVGTGAASQGQILVGSAFRDSTSTATFEARVADVARQLDQIELWRRGTAVAAVCDPARPLTWADFTGPVTGTYSAFTGFDHTLETVGGEQIIRATFAPGRSYVQPAMKDPSNRATSGCGAVIQQCETLLRGRTDATLPLAATGTCAAGIEPDPSVVATSSATCSTVLGPECDRVRIAESARLLRHEQLHFDIACVLARKGTRALSLKPGDSVRLLQAVKDKARDLSSDAGAYDTETDHSCVADQQAAWETSVGQGLPLVTIT